MRSDSRHRESGIWNAAGEVLRCWRLDLRVLEWLRSKGEGHLACINDILLNLMEA